MRILFCSAHPYMPQLYGGAQSSTHDLAGTLMAAGHDVAVLAGLTKGNWLGACSRIKLKLGKRPYVCDRRYGYTTFRAWFPEQIVGRVLRDFGADVVVLQSGRPVSMCQGITDPAIRRFIYLRNVELEDLGGDPRGLAGIGFIANSHFTARRYHDLFGIRAEVVYPLVRPEIYRTETTRRNVTFINPHPCKGLDIAAALAARCPDIPFCFVRGWTLSPNDEFDLQHRIAPLTNVTLRKATFDMRSVYRDAGIVIMPSRWEEAFGRVAAEAQLSGIPVIGTDCGGLPEAIGPGGQTIAADAPIEAWVSALRGLWDDASAYQLASEAALAHSRRAAMDREEQTRRLLGILSGAPVSVPGQASAIRKPQLRGLGPAATWMSDESVCNP